MVAHNVWRKGMINSYLNDYEQWEALKEWWKKYNAIIIVTFSLVLLALSAYKYWNWHLEQRNVQASNSYEHMMLASANHQSNKIELYANELVDKYPESIYSDAARLALAKLAVLNHDYKKAELQLEIVAKESKLSELSDVAKIRLARIWLVQKQFSQALKTLEGMDSKVYRPLVDEMKGDIYTSMNQFDKAVQFYRKALSEVQDYGVGNLFLEMKSNDLLALSNQNSLTQVSMKK